MQAWSRTLREGRWQGLAGWVHQRIHRRCDSKPNADPSAEAHSWETNDFLPSVLVSIWAPKELDLSPWFVFYPLATDPAGLHWTAISLQRLYDLDSTAPARLTVGEGRIGTVYWCMTIFLQAAGWENQKILCTRCCDQGFYALDVAPIYLSLTNSTCVGRKTGGYNNDLPLKLCSSLIQD